MANNAEHVKTDLLIIGSGLAGCRAAIAASDNGLDGENILILNKGRFLASGSSFYPWVGGIGYSASLPELMPEDGPEVHFQDVMKAGAETCDHKLVKILTGEAEKRLHDLMDLGVPVKVLETGKPHGGPGLCFNTYWRGDGLKMEHLRSVFSSQFAKRGVQVRDRMCVVNLLGDPHCCRGAVAVDGSGNPVVIEAKATVLAAGGGSPVFLHYQDTPELTGDGYALALRMGAELVNLEFYQIAWGVVHPREAVLPTELNLYNNPLMEGKLPRFLNARNEEFFPKYLPAEVSLMECVKTRLWHYPFSTRLISKWFDIGIFSEIKEGRGTLHNGIWADFRGLVDEPPQKKQHETIAGKYHRQIVDAWSRPVELSLLVHAFNGGIRIDEHTSTGVGNLFACGESAGGMHSADRLGGMACASTQVFGARAGWTAARTALENPASAPVQSQVNASLAYIQQVLARSGGKTPSEIRKNIQKTMWMNGMICKDEKGLADGIETLEQIRERDLPLVNPQKDSDVFGAFDIWNLWQTAHIIATVSMARKESRGPHYRTDFPEPDPALAGSFVVSTGEYSGPGTSCSCKPRLVRLSPE